MRCFLLSIITTMVFVVWACTDSKPSHGDPPGPKTSSAKSGKCNSSVSEPCECTDDEIMDDECECDDEDGKDGDEGCEEEEEKKSSKDLKKECNDSGKMYYPNAGTLECVSGTVLVKKGTGWCTTTDKILNELYPPVFQENGRALITEYLSKGYALDQCGTKDTIKVVVYYKSGSKDNPYELVTSE